MTQSTPLSNLPDLKKYCRFFACSLMYSGGVGLEEAKKVANDYTLRYVEEMDDIKMFGENMSTRMKGCVNEGDYER